MIRSTLLSFLLLVLLASCASSQEQGSVTSKVQSIKQEARPKANDSSAPQVDRPRTKAHLFSKETMEYGLAGHESVHNYAVDWSGDGITDLVVLPDFYSTPVFFIYHAKEKKFKKVATTPLSHNLRASYLVFADFNKDHNLDVIVGTLNQKTELTKHPLRLFLGQGKGISKKYIEVEDAFPRKKMPTSAITLIDVNMDGLLDVYAANWYEMKEYKMALSPDRLFIAESGGIRFRDVSGALEGEHEYNDKLKTYVNATPAFGSSQCDIDQNGFPDILVASSSGYGNRAWLNLKKNNGQGRFLRDMGKTTGIAADEEGSYTPLGGGNTFYTICSDYNNDGIIDLAVGELFHSYDNETKDRSSILTGSTTSFPPKYIRTEYHTDDGSGRWSQGDRRGVWSDLTHDGLLDLAIENSGFPPKSRLILFTQDENHSFADEAYDYGIDLVNPSGLVTADLNRDGRLDIVVGQSRTRGYREAPGVNLFVNKVDLAQRRTIKVILRGKKANYHGLGASVFFQTSSGRYFRNVDYAQGALPSQNEEGVWFTLTEGEAPFWFEVRWPYLVKNKNGTQYPLVKKYKFSLKYLKYKHIKLILNDQGQIKLVGHDKT